MATRAGPVYLAVLGLLSDGPLTMSELVSEASLSVPPARASRTAERLRAAKRRSDCKKMQPPRPRSIEQDVLTGSRHVAYNCILAAIRRGALVREGDMVKIP